ncbi:MAG: 6-bladed beta-propeller [Muribaculaceae bacterium]|nr:6-bladed beta-propeller [Muribaculaceae bacterium]
MLSRYIKPIVYISTLSYMCAFSVLFTGCSGKHNSSAQGEAGKTLSTLEIKLNPKYYDQICKDDSKIDYVILNEGEDNMFVDLDKLLIAEGNYYILDRYSSRSVLSFSSKGEPLHKFGNIGNGPGEYMFPQDMDVDSTGVYVLDTNTRKVIRYSHDGTYSAEHKIPFNADAFKRLSNGNFLFNLSPDGVNTSALAITDSLMQPIKYFSAYAKEYLGGCATNNVLRSVPDGILYYRSPADTILHLSNNGEILGNYVLDFKDKAIPEIAKTDFVTFCSSGVGDRKDYLRLVDSPIPAGDNIWIGQLEDNGSQYSMIFNTNTNDCGTSKFSKESSVFDFIEPLTATADGAVVSLMVEELAEMCSDYAALPDSNNEGMALRLLKF